MASAKIRLAQSSLTPGALSEPNQPERFLVVAVGGGDSISVKLDADALGSGVVVDVDKERRPNRVAVVLRPLRTTSIFSRRLVLLYVGRYTLRSGRYRNRRFSAS